MSSTQLSGEDAPGGGFRGVNRIQGSRAIANLVDFGCIMAKPTKEELEIIAGFQEAFHFQPNLVTDVYKNRRGRWVMVRIWSLNNLGSCRKEDLFVTTPDMKPIEEFQIIKFLTEGEQSYKELEELFNTGVVTPAIEEEFYVDTEASNTLAMVADAFGDDSDARTRVEGMDFDDLI